jgi:hypothetical protein
MELQLDLFYEIDEVEALKLQVADLKVKQDNLRMGIFKRHGELANSYVSLLHDVESMKVEIDRLRSILPLANS